MKIDCPWHACYVRLDASASTVEIVVEFRLRTLLSTISQSSEVYDTCQSKNQIIVDVPRVTCYGHDVMQIDTLWADRGSHFTALFE